MSSWDTPGSPGPNDPQPGRQPPFGQQPPYGQQPPGQQPAYQGQPAPQQGYQPPNYGSMPPVQASDQAKGFFGSLFDFSFNSFVTPKIVKLVYVVSTIAIALFYVVIVVSGFTKSPALGIGLLLFGAIVAIVYLAFIRMTLEFYYAIVRMSEDINRRLPKV
jgi:Domain of unknown function (DUF4282)